MKEVSAPKEILLSGEREGERFDLSLVIPAYNEEQRLPQTLELVNEYLQQQSYSFEIIVVDDGSADGTSRLVKDLQKNLPRLGLIRLLKNRGKGFAVRTGILHSRGRIVIFTDADLSTPIQEVEKLWPFLEEGHDVVIGTRRNPESKIIVPQGWLRRFLGGIYVLLNRWLGIKRVEDVTCGFKGFRRESAQKIFQLTRLNGWSFDSEVLYIAQRKFGLPLKQVPIEWRNFSGSKVHIFRDIVASLRDLIKIKLYDLRGLYK
jgi:dolichyl-phosphate beta-glucosyltransferase